ncbi:MAG: hypothetical protein ACOVO3_08125 [Fluviicola sp.]|jgi:hypothetical protein
MKVLILAYDYPPYISVGSLRPKAWCEFFPEDGLKPIIVTRQWQNTFSTEQEYVRKSVYPFVVKSIGENSEVYKTPYHPNRSNKLINSFGPNKFRYLRRVLTGIQEVGQYFLPIGTKREIFRFADEYLKTQGADLIIATGDPFVLFHYANKLSKIHGIPWVADYRDVWSQFNYKSKSVFNKFERIIERHTVKNASLITTVSSEMACLIQLNFRQIPLEVVMNGFFEHESQIQSDHTDEQKLKIVHAGSLYPWYPVEIVLSSLDRWMQNDQQKIAALEVHFYGLNDKKRVQIALDSCSASLKHKVFFHPRIENNRMLEELKSYDLLLLFNNYSFLGTKLFDYFSVKRNVLFCFESDSDAETLKNKHYKLIESAQQNLAQVELIRKHTAGYVVIDKTDLVQVLDTVYTEKMSSGKLRCNTKDIEMYSRRYQTRRFAQLLKEHFKRN